MLFRKEILKTWMDPTDRAVFARVSKACRAAVEAADLPQFQTFRGHVALPVKHFVTSAAMLRWAREQRCPWEVRTAEAVAKGGCLEALRWAREHGCPWDPSALTSAAAGGHLACVMYALYEGCPLDEHYFLKMFIGAARGGHLEILRFFSERGFFDDVMSGAVSDPDEIEGWAYVTSQAAEGGHLDVLQWMRERGFPWDESTCSSAAGEAHFEVLRWARERGAPWGPGTCDAAAWGGHFELLKWLHDNNCPWDAMTCAHLAAGGNLQMLRWARERGCPWDEETCIYAADNEQLEMLKWVIEHGCKWNKKKLLRSMRSSTKLAEKNRSEYANNEEVMLRFSASIEGLRRVSEYVQSLDGDGR